MISYSSSQLQLSKFHNWVYYIITLITEYDVINNFTTETYETLYKEWVNNNRAPHNVIVGV
jgi:hypothetical protein